ncbi:MAG: hypothetical protein KGZ97_02120 [Bacteroidetes bacterium]|nr:hypothetical protein [Bacteroidota bacterium]
MKYHECIDVDYEKYVRNKVLFTKSYVGLGVVGTYIALDLIPEVYDYVGNSFASGYTIMPEVSIEIGKQYFDYDFSVGFGLSYLSANLQEFEIISPIWTENHYRKDKYVFRLSQLKVPLSLNVKFKKLPYQPVVSAGICGNAILANEYQYWFFSVYHNDILQNSSSNYITIFGKNYALSYFASIGFEKHLYSNISFFSNIRYEYMRNSVDVPPSSFLYNDYFHNNIGLFVGLKGSY